MTLLIDTHIHLDYLANPAAEIAAAKQAGVGGFVVPGTAPDRWPLLLMETGRERGVFAAPGIHPQFAAHSRPADFDTMRQLLEHPAVVAVGEVGLDRRVDVPQAVQEEVFVRMIHLALDAGKPLLIHERQSTGRVLEILRREEAGRVGGIFHAFSGSLETARGIIALGFALGIGGVVTYPNARRLPELLGEVPAEALVLETDAPDMAPEPYRGEPNRAAHLTLIAARLAQLSGWSPAETARITTANARRVLRLPDDRNSWSGT